MLPSPVLQPPIDGQLRRAQHGLTIGDRLLAHESHVTDAQLSTHAFSVHAAAPFGPHVHCNQNNRESTTTQQRQPKTTHIFRTYCVATIRSRKRLANRHHSAIGRLAAVGRRAAALQSRAARIQGQRRRRHALVARPRSAVVGQAADLGASSDTVLTARARVAIVLERAANRHNGAIGSLATVRRRWASDLRATGNAVLTARARVAVVLERAANRNDRTTRSLAAASRRAVQASAAWVHDRREILRAVVARHR
jgi:hypothetical protein